MKLDIIGVNFNRRKHEIDIGVNFTEVHEIDIIGGINRSEHKKLD
jgi:hypothetical protein